MFNLPRASGLIGIAYTYELPGVRTVVYPCVADAFVILHSRSNHIAAAYLAEFASASLTQQHGHLLPHPTARHQS